MLCYTALQTVTKNSMLCYTALQIVTKDSYVVLHYTTDCN